MCVRERERESNVNASEQSLSNLASITTDLRPCFFPCQFCLRQCLTNARRDLLKLRELQCPFLVVAIGLNFCPPSLALESAPMGSLHSLLQSRVEEVDRKVVHYILLQVSAGVTELIDLNQ